MILPGGILVQNMVICIFIYWWKRSQDTLQGVAMEQDVFQMVSGL